METAPTATARMSRRLSDVTLKQRLANNGLEVRLHQNGYREAARNSRQVDYLLQLTRCWCPRQVCNRSLYPSLKACRLLKERTNAMQLHLCMRHITRTPIGSKKILHLYTVMDFEQAARGLPTLIRCRTGVCESGRTWLLVM